MFCYTVELYQPMLGIVPKGFNTVDILCTTSELIVTVMHSEMLRKAHVNRSLITAPPISIDDVLNRDMASDNLLQRDFRGIGDDFGIHFEGFAKVSLCHCALECRKKSFCRRHHDHVFHQYAWHQSRIHPVLRCPTKVSVAHIRQPNADAISGIDCYASDTDSCQFGGVVSRQIQGEKS